MKKENIRILIKCIPSILLFSFIIISAISNKVNIKTIYNKWKRTNFAVSFDKAEETLNKNYTQKSFFVNLNGLMAKTLGIHTLNEIQDLPNGWLTYADKTEYNIDKINSKFEQLSTFLDDNQIDYVCVPISAKNAFYDTKFYKGHSTEEKKVYNMFIDQLEEKQINVINMNDWFQKNDWKMEEVYFKTDHHWKPEAALQTTSCIVENLYEHKIIENDESIYRIDNWNIDVYKDWFLGSHGKRTGTKYAGVDDLSYIYPKFETDIIIHRFHEDKINDTKNCKDVYDTSYLKDKDYYEKNAYCLYLGGDFPLTYIQNNKAIEKRKIMVIGDSYRLPVECFLSSMFSEVYHVDTRAYKEGTFAELVQEIKPDIVLVIFTVPGSIGALQFGINEWHNDYGTKTEKIQLANANSINLLETKGYNNFQVIYPNIVKGSYEINIDSIKLSRDSDLNSDNDGGCVQFSLMDLNSGQVVKSRYFISEYKTSQKWIFTVPENGNANYAIIAYNGMMNDTYGNTTTISNFSINQYQ